MIKSNNVIAVVFIIFSCFTISHSLKCYVCNSRYNCKDALLKECDDANANYTRNYLDTYHVGINATLTSPNYECFSEQLLFDFPGNTDPTNYGEYYVKGCIYDNIKGCEYPLSIQYNQTCYQCAEDGCNPYSSGRVNFNALTVFSTIVTAFIVRSLCH